MVSQIKVNEIIKQSGSSISIGESGDTITLPSSATLSNFPDSTPYFIATMSGSDQSVSSNTTTKAAFNSQTAATSGTYDTSNYRFTPGVSGTYQVYGRLFTHASGVTFRGGVIFIYKNGLNIYNVEIPKDSSWEKYNKDHDWLRELIYKKPHVIYRVPYKYNRAIIFNASLPHDTDDVSMKPGQKNKRVSYTMLYGKGPFNND